MVLWSGHKSLQPIDSAGRSDATLCTNTYGFQNYGLVLDEYDLLLDIMMSSISVALTPLSTA